MLNAALATKKLPQVPAVVSCALQIAQAKFSRWAPRPSALSDVLWALAHARHWTPLLTQLESCTLAAGGPAACTAAEAVTSIWAFAVLGHTPQQLLQQLDAKGWAVKADKSQAPQLPNRPQASTTSSSSSSDGLAALRDSQLCTLAWSLACLSQVEGSLFKTVWGEVCSRGPGLAADTRQAVQLAQAALAIQLEGSYQPQDLLPGQGETQGCMGSQNGQDGADFRICASVSRPYLTFGSLASFQLHTSRSSLEGISCTSATTRLHCSMNSQPEAVAVCVIPPYPPPTNLRLCAVGLCAVHWAKPTQTHAHPDLVFVLLLQAPQSCCQLLLVCLHSRARPCRHRRPTAATSAPLLAHWHAFG
jgi:hypothetical protein